MSRRGVAAVLVAVLLPLGACAAPVAEQGGPPAAPASAAVVPAPVAVLIPELDVSSTLMPLGLDAAGALEVPPEDRPQQAGWYRDGVIPGQAGPAVIAGHVNGRVQGVSTPGVFARLHELTVGDEVFVERSDAPRLRFEVYRVERHPKDSFPTEAVYGDVEPPRPELRLITCGGEFDRSTGNYLDNTIVWAALTSEA